MRRPSKKDVALWIIHRNDGNPLVRDLASSLLAGYIAQLEEANDALTRELLRDADRAVLAFLDVPKKELCAAEESNADSPTN